MIKNKDIIIANGILSELYKNDTKDKLVRSIHDLELMYKKTKDYNLKLSLYININILRSVFNDICGD